MSNAHIRRIQRRKRERLDREVEELAAALEAEVMAMFGADPDPACEQFCIQLRPAPEPITEGDDE
jgi:hypothetical protein